MSERRVSVYLVVLGLVVVLLVLTAYLGKAYSGHGGSRDVWVRKNELVLASLPVYPGAVEKSAPYSFGNLDPNVGSRSYWTVRTYTLPAGATSDLVLSFYRGRLAEWTEHSGSSSCDINFRRDKAMLGVNACNGKLDLVVNYRESA